MVERLFSDNSGDVKPVGVGIADQLRPWIQGLLPAEGNPALIILLAGGDKSSQAKDIDEALLLADNLTEET